MVTATKGGWTTGLPRTLGQHGEDSGQKYCENAKQKTKDRVDEHCKVWRGRLLQDQAWNWALWSEYLVVVVNGGLVNFYLFLTMTYHCSRWALFTIPLPIVLLEKLNKLHPTENKPKSKSNTFSRVLMFGTANFRLSSVFSRYSAVKTSWGKFSSFGVELQLIIKYNIE